MGGMHERVTLQLSWAVPRKKILGAAIATGANHLLLIAHFATRQPLKKEGMYFSEEM